MARRVAAMILVILVGATTAQVGWAVERSSAVDGDRVEFKTGEPVLLRLASGERRAVYARTSRNEFVPIGGIDFDHWPDDYRCTSSAVDATVEQVEGTIRWRAIDADHQWMRAAFVRADRASEFTLQCTARFDGPLAVASVEPLNVAKHNVGQALAIGGVAITVLGPIAIASALLIRRRSRRRVTSAPTDRQPAPT